MTPYGLMDGDRVSGVMDGTLRAGKWTAIGNFIL